MSIFSETCIRLEGKNKQLYHTLRRAVLAIVFLSVAILAGLLWRPVFEQVQDSLIAAVLIGLLMLSLIVSVIKVVRPKR